MAKLKRTKPLYFTISKAKTLINANFSKYSDERLQKARIKLLDYNRLMTDDSPYGFEMRKAGGYYKSVAHAEATGLSPKDIWLSKNLDYALERADKELKKRIKR